MARTKKENQPIIKEEIEKNDVTNSDDNTLALEEITEQANKLNNKKRNNNDKTLNVGEVVLITRDGIIYKDSNGTNHRIYNYSYIDKYNIICYINLC